jgi:hypothetical protein
MKIKCNAVKNSELSLIRHFSGVLYHLAGNYSLTINDKEYFPVNRSYVPDTCGDRRCDCGIFSKSKVIHDQIDINTGLLSGEKLINIFGSNYLYLQVDKCDFCDSRKPNISNDVIFNKVFKGIKTAIFKNKIDMSVDIGVSGSYLAGLNNILSDIDLITWVDWDCKSQVSSVIEGTLVNFGFKPVSKTPANNKYIDRYSDRFKISKSAGSYLADKRFRWVDPNGKSVSLQLFNKKYNYSKLGKFFNMLGENYKEEEVSLTCKTIESSLSYNMPKIWVVEVDGSPYDVFSLSWMHQGMGEENDGSEKNIKAKKITFDKQVFFVLSGTEHYILPKNLFFQDLLLVHRKKKCILHIYRNTPTFCSDIVSIFLFSYVQYHA